MSDPSSSEPIINPRIRVAELDEFFRQVRQVVLALEDAYRSGDLRQVIQNVDLERRFGTALFRVYQTLIGRTSGPDPHGRRLESVYALLDQVRDEVFKIDTWFYLEMVEPATNATEDEPSESAGEPAPRHSRRNRYRVAPGSEPPIDLRLDQVIAARSWGIGFLFDDQRLTDQLTEMMAGRTVRQFARDLADLGKVLPRVLQAEPGRFPPLVAPRSGLAFEQLIVDILNEPSEHASLATLSEDYSQKTDLRVRYNDLERKRGARVQVTLAATQESYQKKVADIRRADQFVILSPWSLACSVPQLMSGQAGCQPVPFAPELIQRFWSCIQGQPADAESLARALQQILRQAIETPIRDPRGPLACVPEPLREFIRTWVREEAIRSTLALREWELNYGRYRETADGRLFVHAMPRAGGGSAVRQFLEQHPIGSRVRGRISELRDRFAWMDLGDGLRGQILSEELTWAAPRGNPKRMLKVGEETEAVVLAPSPSTDPPTIRLSLKRLLPDPWLAAETAAYQVGGIEQGRVRGLTSFGLFVELRPNVVGLLHQSQLPETVGQTWESFYAPGDSLWVQIVAIDRETRRISLSLAGEKATAQGN